MILLCWINKYFEFPENEQEHLMVIEVLVVWPCAQTSVLQQE